jgi:chorismate mutase/prephenate dehydratase
MTLEQAKEALARCRDQIDIVDLQIVELLNARTRIVEEIGRIKQQVDLPIYEPAREDAVYRNVVDNNGGPMPEDSVRRVFERIIDEMRKIQRVRMGR